MDAATLLNNFDVLAEAPNGIPKLREMILQLAVQGKLVPQDPTDEPASALLAKINEEKEKLIAEGIIKNSKPLPNVQEGEVSFSLPFGWQWTRMSAVANHRLGKMLDKNKNKGSLRPYLRNTNVQWLRFNLEDLKEMRIHDDEIEEFRLMQDDLLICEGGEPGRCAIWNSDVEEMYFQKAIHRVRPFGCVNPWYLLYCIMADAGSGSLSKYFTGATIKHFTGKELASYCFGLPPLAEQKRIVAKVDQLMALCDDLEVQQTAKRTTRVALNNSGLDRLLTSQQPTEFRHNWKRVHNNFDLLYDNPANVQKLRQAILQLAVMGKLVPQDPNDEPASNLLIEIEGMQQENKNKKSKEISKIKLEEVPYQLPNSPLNYSASATVPVGFGLMRPGLG